MSLFLEQIFQKCMQVKLQKTLIKITMELFALYFYHDYKHWIIRLIRT